MTTPARWRRPRAFTIVELMIVVTIIALLGAMVMPAFQRVLQHVRGNTLINDLRVFSSSLLQYAHSNGDYPATSTAAGIFPPEMAGILAPDQWTRSAPIGGNYEFLRDTTVGGVSYRALIRVSAAAGTAIAFTSTQLLSLDQRFDDGSLTAGQLFTNGAALTTYYVVEK